MPDIFQFPQKSNSHASVDIAKKEAVSREGIQIKDAASDLGSLQNASSHQIWQGNDNYDAIVPQMRYSTSSIPLTLYNQTMEGASDFGGDAEAQNIKNLISQYVPVRSMSIASNSSLSQIGKLNPTHANELARASINNEIGRDK